MVRRPRLHRPIRSRSQHCLPRPSTSGRVPSSPCPSRRSRARRVLSLLVLAVAASVIAPPAHAFFPTEPPPPRESNPLDDLRLRALEANYAGRYAECLELVRQALAQDAEDGYSLRQLALTCRDHGRIGDLANALRGEGTFEPIPATEAGRALTLGIIDNYRYRHTTALGHLNRALELRPGWAWALFYRARVRIDMGVPEAEVDSDLMEAYRDPEVAPDVLQYLFRTGHQAQRDPALLARIEALLPADDPLFAHEVAARRLRFGPELHHPTLDEVRAAWKEHHEAYGDRAGYAARELSSIVEEIASPADALAFADERLAENAPGNAWRWLRADALGSLGRTTALRAELDGPPLDGYTRAVVLDAVGVTLPPERVEPLAEQLRDETWADIAENFCTSVFRSLGQTARADSIDEAGRLEHPTNRLWRRMLTLLSQDPERALGVCDSLVQEGALLRRVPRWRVAALDGVGEHEEAERIFARQPSHEAMGMAWFLAYAADGQGKHDRAEFWAGKAAEIASPFGWERSFVGMGLRDDRTERLEQWLEGSGSNPAGPLDQELRWDVLASLGRFDQLRAEIDRASLDAEAEDLLILVDFGFRLDDPAFARTAIEAARPKASDWTTFRASEGLVLREEGKLDEAAAIFAELADQFPGHAPYRLAASPNEVLGLDDLAASQEPPQTPGLEPPDDSIDWIVQAIAEADTVQDLAAVRLRESVTLVCDDPGWYTQRVRRVALPLTEEGADFYRTLTIPFEPSNGVPVVELARVVHPDGRVVEVPRSEILVSAIEDEGTSVSDDRQLVIPFRELRPGSVADLVCRWNDSSSFGHGIATSYFFGETNPIREEILEFRIAESLNFRPTLHDDGVVPWEDVGESRSASVDTVANRIVYRWTARDIAPIEAFTDGPDLREVYPWIALSTFRDWDDALSGYRDNLWQRMEPSEDLRAEAEAVVEGAPNESARVDSLYRHVVDTVDYLALAFGTGRIVPNKPQEIRDRGYGDCKDMVSYLVALATSAGVEAEPVLVGVPPDLEPTDEYVDPGLFDHMIVRFPKTNRFADPTAGRRTATVGASLCGIRGVALPRRGSVQIVSIPPARYQEHGFTAEVDVHPLDDTQARFEITIEYRGDLAETGASIDQVTEPEYRDYWIDRIIAYGAPSTSVRQDWSMEWISPTSVRFEATYIDTAWAQEGANQAAFRFVTEVADPFLSYPGADDRITPMRIELPFENRAVLRFHGTEVWEPVAKIATARLDGPLYEGRIESDQHEEDGHPVVEVTQSFRLERTRLTADEYRDFREDWIRFAVPVNQAFQYRRVLKPDELKRITDFAGRFPDDVGFAIQAAIRILGNDRGGTGPSGEARRAAARTILEPILGAEDVGAMPYLLLSGIAQTEGRYRDGDAILAEGLARYPSDLYLTLNQVLSKQALDEWEEEAAAIVRLSKLYANDGLQLRLISLETAMDDPAGAEQAEARYLALAGEVDSTRIAMAKIDGFLLASRCDEARAEMESAVDYLDPEFVEALNAKLGIDCRNAEACLDFFERAWENNPVDPGVCNNLAWAYALCGQNLERAETLAEAAIILANDDSAVRNTLGVVYVRQGRWDDAKKLFEEINVEDDRPGTQTVNTYFIGLCQYATGDVEEALQTWKTAIEMGGDMRFQRAAEESIARHAESLPVADVIFENWEP